MSGNADETEKRRASQEGVVVTTIAMEPEEDSESEKEEEEVLINRKVIDEKLVRDSVLEELETADPGLSLKAEDVDLEEISGLALSFKNIFAVDNLLGVEQITKLQLDNNIIDKIQNLGHLVNLKWLDLSFNNISKIEGLDKLVHLTDLSLFNNRLTKIENLESCTKLNVLSLGNNMISELGGIEKLRQFGNLRLLNLKGNPVCSNADYHNTIFAFLDKLKYLDYELVEDAQLQKARDSKLEKLIDLAESEKEQRENNAVAKGVAEKRALLKAANLEGIDVLLHTVVSEDDQRKKLSKLPGYAELLETYHERFTGTTDELSKQVLEMHAKKEAEKTEFTGVLLRASTAAEDDSIEKIQSFEAQKKKAYKAYEESKDDGVLQGLQQEIAMLSDALMDIEMLVVETNNDLLDEFEARFAKLVRTNSQIISGQFSEVNKEVAWYVSELKTMVHNLLDRLADAMREDGIESANLPPEAVPLLANRDDILTSAGLSQECHEGKIMAEEDKVNTREDSNAKLYCKQARQDEYDRNRFRVEEIQMLIMGYNDEVEQLQNEAAEDEEYNW